MTIQRTAIVTVLLAAPIIALADDSCDSRTGRGCPPGNYSPMHYWTPAWYELRSFIRPVNFDQYAPGPNPPVAPSYLYNKYRCPAVTPAPSTPYGNPDAYFGRTVPAKKASN